MKSENNHVKIKPNRIEINRDIHVFSNIKLSNNFKRFKLSFVHSANSHINQSGTHSQCASWTKWPTKMNEKKKKLEEKEEEGENIRTRITKRIRHAKPRPLKTLTQAHKARESHCVRPKGRYDI